MSDLLVIEIGQVYVKIDVLVKEMGCGLWVLFMILFFMVLLVIFKIKFSDFGMFDVEVFCFYQIRFLVRFFIFSK